MSFTRLFDIAHFAAKSFPKSDMFVTKYHGEWKKTSSQEYLNMGNQFSRGLLKLGI